MKTPVWESDNTGVTPIWILTRNTKYKVDRFSRATGFYVLFENIGTSKVVRLEFERFLVANITHSIL